MDNVTVIGIDIGGVNTTGYTMIDGKEKMVTIKSIRGPLKEFDYDRYTDSIAVNNYVVGRVALFETEYEMNSNDFRANNPFVRTMIEAVLSELNVTGDVCLMLGTRDRNLTKIEYNSLVKEYQGKTLEVYDHVNEIYKEFYITDILIEGEALAAYHCLSRLNPDMKKGRVVVCTVGYRTLEIGVYNNGVYSRNMSTTVDLGAYTALRDVRAKVQEQYKQTYSFVEIDMEDNWNQLKIPAYNQLFRRITEELKSNIENYTALPVYFTGGTAMMLKKIVPAFNYTLTDDPLTDVAKGLYYQGRSVWS